MRHLCWYINLNFDIIQFFVRKLTCLNLLLGIKLVLWRFLKYLRSYTFIMIIKKCSQTFPNISSKSTSNYIAYSLSTQRNIVLMPKIVLRTIPWYHTVLCKKINMPELTSWDQTSIMAVFKISTFLYFYND